MVAVAIVLGIGLFVERSFVGDAVTQDTVPVLAFILSSASWLTERRLLRASSDENLPPAVS
jgi:hypothetical protein